MCNLSANFEKLNIKFLSKVEEEALDTQSTLDVNWTYIRRSEDVQDFLCTFNLSPVSTG